MAKKTRDIVVEIEHLLSRQIEALGEELTPDVIVNYSERNRQIRKLLERLVHGENSKN